MAMDNMAKVMLDMKMEDRPKYMMQQQELSLGRGKALFSDARLGRNGQTCNSCHPGGGTTGGEAEIPMKGRFPMNPKLPIPTLVGAGASFPKGSRFRRLDSDEGAEKRRPVSDRRSGDHGGPPSGKRSRPSEAV